MIGIAGNTGFSDGYHLHINVYEKNNNGIFERKNPLFFFQNEITFLRELGVIWGTVTKD